MKDRDRQVHEVEGLELEIESQILGVMQCPMGSNKVEMEHFQGVSNQWQEQIRTFKLDQQDVWSDLTLRVIKPLEGCHYIHSR